MSSTQSPASALCGQQSEFIQRFMHAVLTFLPERERGLLQQEIAGGGLSQTPLVRLVVDNAHMLQSEALSGRVAIRSMIERTVHLCAAKVAEAAEYSLAGSALHNAEPYLSARS